MKASILKRLEALEQAASQTTIPRLRIVDVFQLPDGDRTAYWNGDPDVLNRYAPPIPDMPQATIATIVISLNADSRTIWEATRDMNDDEYDRWDDQRIREAEQKRSEPVPEPEQEPRFDKWGYRVSD